MNRDDLKQVGDHLYEIPQAYRGDMQVPARIYADEDILDAALRDRSLEQLVNTATLPGVVEHVLAMPDIHQGYGFCIGGVAAVRHPEGVISPGGVGYDINCGVRLLVSRMDGESIAPFIGDLMDALYRDIPSGLGKEGGIRLSARDMDRVLTSGAGWAVIQGYGLKDDLVHAEEEGALAGAEPDKVSQRARERGRKQLGTLGSGNHFIEVGKVTDIFDPDVAEIFGVWKGQVVLWIHSGSRGLGHQVCTDYVRSLQDVVRRYRIHLPDRELVCAPLDSNEGRRYFGAMACAANFAWANRQCLAHLARRSFESVLAGKVKDWELSLVYDVAHNIAKMENHQLDRHRRRLLVHRKGATRSLGPGAEALPPRYKDVGQPVLIPGDMGTASYVMVGTEEATRNAFSSTCHGAGRLLSRKAARKRIRGGDLLRRLQQEGIEVRAGSMRGLSEEAPGAYKDIDRVVEVVHKAGLARKVARVRPLGVVKG
jgi:tRNA-splicing ligase RtcB